MFLDDELFNMCIDLRVDTPGYVQKLNLNLCRKCESYYKSKIHMGMTEKDVKTILNRTFNLFDSFVRKLKESENKQMQILGELFEEFTFRKQFLSDAKMNKFYINLR